MEELNIFKLTKVWFEYKAEHPDLNGNHTEFLFYCVDLNNRLAWKEVFGLPALETAEFLNISYNTFRKILKDFTDKYKLIRLVEKSTNQYNSNKISLDLLYQNLLKQKKSTYKAFIKAQQKQLSKQSDIDTTLLHNNINTLLHLKDKELNQILISENFKNFLLEKKLKIVTTEIKEKINYTDFLNQFNKITNRKFRILDTKTKNQIIARIKEGFTIAEILQASKNCKNDKYHIENPKYLTPEFITRSDKLQKYLYTDSEITVKTNGFKLEDFEIKAGVKITNLYYITKTEKFLLKNIQKFTRNNNRHLVTGMPIKLN